MRNLFNKLRNSDPAFLCLVFLSLILIRIPALALPGFWDEAWSYLPAILKMSETGPTLLPDVQYAELFRGHPLLFYFLASIWTNLFGTSFVAMRIFPLTISIFLLWVLFRFAKTHFGRKTAVVSVILTAIQSLFLAQSSLLLPEMLLALFTLLTLDAFLSGKKWLFVLWGTLLVFTKETGVVLLLSCLLFSISDLILKREKPTPASVVRTGAYLLLPLILIILFFILQRYIMGWFFFPEHIGLVDFSFASILHRLEGYSAFLFIGFGRSLLTFAAGASLIYILVRRIPIDKTKLEVLLKLLAFLVLYLLFLSVNFYSPRYLLSVLPVFIVLSLYMIHKTLEGHRLLTFFACLLLVGWNGWFTWTARTDADHNLGYADAVEVHRQVIRYCEEQQWQGKTIATHFLMGHYLTHPADGYLSTGSVFSPPVRVLSDSTEVALITSTEFSKPFMKSIQIHNLLMMKRFEKRNAWAEVYMVK